MIKPTIKKSVVLPLILPSFTTYSNNLKNFWFVDYTASHYQIDDKLTSLTVNTSNVSLAV